MPKKQEQVSQMETLIGQAKESKHGDAILLLAEKKDMIQYKVQAVSAPFPDAVKKSFAILAELVFSSCVDILANDKK